MRISHAALFSGISLLVALLFTLLMSGPGLEITGVQLPRQDWLLNHGAIWQICWWLWLVAIFGWMVLLVTLMWRYSPAHRVATILQSGLMLISATLAIGGCLVWMNLLPIAITQEDPASMMQLTDTLALTLVGSGLFMGGIVTAWIGIDLFQLNKLTLPYVGPGILAGICAIPSPFLLPSPLLLFVGAIFWIGWSIFWATRRREPPPFPEIL